VYTAAATDATTEIPVYARSSQNTESEVTIHCDKGELATMFQGKYILTLLLLVATAGTSFAVPLAGQGAKEDIKDAGHSAKEVAKDTGRATKKTAKKNGARSDEDDREGRARNGAQDQRGC
jgi:hypothetical protein